MLKDAPLLILDEATAVDNETNALQRSIARMYDRTTIIVAHRLSTVRHSNPSSVENGEVLNAENTRIYSRMVSMPLYGPFRWVKK